MIMDIQCIAKRLVRKYHTSDPFELCSILGIEILYSDLGSIRGVYQYKYRKKMIHINNCLDTNLQRQVCAHELGHAILHKKTNTFFLDVYTFYPVNKVEIEADTFAAELLLDDISPIEYMCCTVDQIAAAENVPKKFVELKCKHLQTIK